MLPRYENRVQLALALLVGLLLLANLFTLMFVALAPAKGAAQAPILFTVFIATLVVSLPSIILLPRWLLRPYRQLMNEAERASVATLPSSGARDEAEFVLETFQAVVAQLQAQQRELEILNAQASARAATAEQFSDRIVASVPSGLVAFDTEGLTTVINAPARQLLATDSNAEGQHVSILLCNAPDLAGMVQQCLETGELYRREEIAMKVAEGNGLMRRLGVTVAPIDFTPGRRARGALCLLTDITEVMQLREQVALKRNLESLGEMSAGLAHEFKNALATLHGYAQLLLKIDGSEQSRAAASALLHEVRSLSEMVTAFLNFARPQPLELMDVSLGELIKECAVELQPFYSERRTTLEVTGTFASVRADERMLRQALLNLLRNAAEAIDEDQTLRNVVVRGDNLKGEAAGKVWAVVEIRDTGGGIPASDLQRIFIPFHTTKSKGHGVGLALAHRVVTEHGGTLSATNRNEGGAVFTIKLPVG